MGNTLRRVLRRCETETRDWTALPDDLVGSIANRLPLPDHTRLRGVCTSWASAADLRIYPPSPSFPWLMLNADGGTGCFLSLTDSRSYCNLPGTVLEKATCVGSSCDGWLVILDVGSNKLFLRNPITAAQINLPSLDTLPWSKSFFDVRKVAVSSSSAVVAVAVFYSLSCCHLAYARAGDEEWTPLDFLSPPNKKRIEDVAYHDGKFFIVFTRGRVQSFDLSGDGPNVSVLYGNCSYISHKLYLVSTSDNLLQVRREKESLLSGITTDFRVGKFEPCSDSGWVEVKSNLGDQCLFLDNRSSFSVSTTAEVRRNCIYFAEEVPHSGKVSSGDLRMFDMEKGTICSLQLPSSKKLMSPVWFMPSV